MLQSELQSKTARLWDAFWSGGVSNPLEIVEQLTYLLFLRILDARYASPPRQPTADEVQSNPVTAALLDERLRWSYLVTQPPQHMFAAVRDEIFPLLRSFDGPKSGLGAHFTDARFTITTPGLLAKVVDLLEDVPVDGAVLGGDFYEHLLSKVATAAHNGQFRTPRHVIQLIIEMTAPEAGENICDPACGTAGFLVAAADYIGRSSSALVEVREQARHDPGAGTTFHGFDFDSTMLRIGSMNMWLHGVSSPDIRYRDSLGQDLGAEAERYSLVLTNPPFAGSLDYESTADDLRRVIHTKKSELLFVALTLKLMKHGGRAAVIVPDGVLFGSTNAHKELRRTLVEDNRLDGVVKLPAGVFKPYAGISTSILFLTKANDRSADSVWFYDVTADGWSLDDRRAPLLPPEKLGALPSARLHQADHAKNNLPDVVKRWLSRGTSERARKRSEQSFLISKAEIAKEGYNLSLTHYRKVHEAKTVAQEWVRLGDFTEIYGGSVPRKEIEPAEHPSDATADRRVLPPSLLDVQLLPVDMLPVRGNQREPRIRLREGDIVGRDLAGTRHWSLLPSAYDGVQPGQGLIVIRPIQNPVPSEYLTAYLASPQAEQQFRLYDVMPRIRRLDLGNVRIPKCEGDAEEIRTFLSRLAEGEAEAQKIQKRLRDARLAIFEKGTSSARRTRLSEAADLSSLIAQNLRKQNERYRLFQDYPYGIARAVRKFQHSTSPAEKHEAALQCVESLILSLGIIAHAIAANRGRQELPEIVQWRKAVAGGGVSLGHWVAVIRAVGADSRETGDPASGLAEATALKKGKKGLMADLDKLVALRNKIRHGSGPRTRAEFERSLEEIERLMFSGLSWCTFLARSRWVHTDRLRWLPELGRFEVSGLVLTGDHPDFEPISFQTDVPLADGSLYMLTQQDEPIQLSPFCLLEDCPTCLTPELYYPDRLTASTALLKSLDRGHELDSDSVYASLRPWTEA
ncbi:N-6 DNA methylase [Streptomyces deccanensis]|uniref:N-6 DNA methylase n=1 Tax=Streptomyces deccanensis TaxID=424188 RepID=UPI001EFAA230|nr:N-6 DNA methylase [Streptomyces deccanensis]ULR53373.1 N-6 DNA methylase [Streptomyces deccanensis]